MQMVRVIWFVIVTPACMIGPASLCAQESEKEYALSPEMVLLERDAASKQYRDGLVDMLSTDLAAEWQRAVNPDDAESFAKKHGGILKVRSNKALLSAHQRRAKISADFLDVMRQEYKRRKLAAPFDAGVEAMTAPAGRGKLGEPKQIDVVFANQAAARQWYRFRGPGGQGHARVAHPPVRWSATENIIWKSPLPGEGNSSPIIWDDRIFLTAATADHATRSVLCYNRYDGELVWKREIKVEKLERQVRDKNGYASASTTTDGERVIAFLGNGGMVCFDLAGNEQWRAALGSFDGTWGPAASPVLYKDLVILAQDQNRGSSITVALDKKTGEVRWRQDRERCMGWCTPIVFRIDGRDEMIYATNTKLLAVDPRTGEELWRCDGPTREPIPSAVAGHGLIYYTSGRNGPTLAVEPGGAGNVTKTGLVWSALRGGPHVPSPVLVDREIYMANDRGILTCLDALSGDTIYQKRLRGKFSASPVAAGGLVYFTNEAGVTYVLRGGRKLDVVAENPLGEPVLASLAFVDDKIYARTAGSLVCIGKP